MHLKDSKFVINCAARTGSTFLVHLLRSNSNILCHGEVINIHKLGALVGGAYGRKILESKSFERSLHEKLLEHPSEFIYDHIYDPQQHAVVGFKFKTDEMFDPRYSRYKNIIAQDEDIKVIHLRRRSLLSQYISHQVVLNQTGVTLLTDNESPPDIVPFYCDPVHARRYFEDVIAREKRSVELYAGHRCIMVDYEDIISEKHNARHDLQAFLGADVQNLSSPTIKIIKDNFKLLTNLSAVIEFLKDSGYEDRI